MKNVKREKTIKAANAKAKVRAKRREEDANEMYRATMVLSAMLAAHVNTVGEFTGIPKEDVERISGAARGIGHKAMEWLECECGLRNDAKKFDRMMGNFRALASIIYDDMWDMLEMVCRKDFGKAEKNT